MNDLESWLVPQEYILRTTALYALDGLILFTHGHGTFEGDVSNSILVEIIGAQVQSTCPLRDYHRLGSMVSIAF